MKKKYLVILGLAGATVFAACNSGYVRRNPGRIYAPDMQYSVAYNAYTENPVTRNGLTSQLPVPGTIARNQPLPKHLKESDTNGYKALTFPQKYTDADLNQGKVLFNIYCAICHGEKLDGNGPLFKSGKFASKPADLVSGNYYLHLPPGMIYHTIEYGKNMMGSYYSQLDERQRWQVIAYIKKTQDTKLGIPFPYAATSGTDTTLASAGNVTSSGTSATSMDSSAAKMK